MADMVAHKLRTWKVSRRPPRSHYYHLSTHQLNRLSKVLSDSRQIDIIRAAIKVGLTQAQLKEAVRRWEHNKKFGYPAKWVEAKGAGGGSASSYWITTNREV